MSRAQAVANATGDAWVADVGCGSNRKGNHFGTDMRSSRMWANYDDTEEIVNMKRARSESPASKSNPLRHCPGVVKMQIGTTEETFNLELQREAFQKFAAATLDVSKKQEEQKSTAGVEWYPEMEMFLNALDRQRAEGSKAKR